MSIFKRNNIFVLVHFICWLILGLGLMYSRPADWGDNIPKQFLIKQSVLLVILMATFYVNYYMLIPRLLIQRKILIYVVLIIALVSGLTLLTNIINELFDLNNLPFQQGYGRDGHHHARWNTFVPGMILLTIGLSITISFIQKWQIEVTLRQQLEQEKVSSELTLLKAQINPHFFFNTLNTIYSYTLSDGETARTAITNLSKMMRYVLYDASGKQTPISKEINFIREYVELMKLRTGKKTTVSINVQEQASELMIAPMLFLPFVENAFKHGVSGVQEGHIAIWIIQSDDGVELRVNNTVYQSKRIAEDKSNGIGILNTARRLDLLYPSKYTLSTGMVGDNEYEAKLKLLV
jgi:two-component system LytT family sensor kinase